MKEYEGKKKKTKEKKRSGILLLCRKTENAQQPELQPVFRCCFVFVFFLKEQTSTFDLSQAFLSCQICKKKKITI